MGKEYRVSAIFLSCFLPEMVWMTNITRQDIVMMTVFLTVAVFFAAVTSSLRILVCRTGDFPRPIMKKNRLVPVLGKFGQPLGKFLVVFCGDKPLRFERQTENFRPAMHEDFAILLVHSETDHVAFLQRAVLQINQDEKQAVGYAGGGQFL